MISLVVAYSKNRVIGINGEMPWYLPEDLKHFKELTLNKIVVMGRRTYESIGHPLPNRINIVVSSTLILNEPNCFTVPSIKDAIAYAGNNDIVFIGGARIYEEALSYVDTMYITEIHQEYEGDTYFPLFDEALFDKHITYESNDTIPYSFITYTRKV
ncbi:MAG: dihydrofolate reductase [Erysipelotrichales bacterium]|nr:dihydrofolate reductase [Erysipelotrichales bacterium]